MITILPLNFGNSGDLNRMDTRFLAGDRVQLRISRKGFTPEYIPLPVAQWRSLKSFPAEPNQLLGDPKVACFLAYTEDHLVGQVIVRLGAHRLCEVLDIRIDSRYRRQGIGTELIQTCADWAVRHKRAGLRIEVSDEQSVACQFLEHCGFQLGGVDRLWHSADAEQAQRMPTMRESVLVFYQFLNGNGRETL